MQKMIATYGAEVPEDAARELLAYLAAHYPPGAIEATYAALPSAVTASTPCPRSRTCSCAALLHLRSRRGSDDEAPL